MEENNQKAFYMVFNSNGHGLIEQHETHASASAEAERLAIRCSGSSDEDCPSRRGSEYWGAGV